MTSRACLKTSPDTDVNWGICDDTPVGLLVCALTAIAAYTLALNGRVPVAARIFLGLFLLSLGAIGLLLGVRLSSGAEWAAKIQPLVAVLVAPLAFLGFRALAEDQPSSWGSALLVNCVRSSSCRPPFC